MKYGFELVEKETIEEIQGEGYVYQHKKNGARLVHLQNSDPNKVFTMTFATPPENNKGTIHIIEHAVGCASKKYPLLDTFNELDKGSLNICLNACTYKDMTKYYCGSQNEKDLYNLIEVYIDLVFHPLMTEDRSIFLQEGWRYELVEEEEVEYNGIVLNEMQGEFCEPSTIYEYEMHRILFNESFYKYDSGGVPSEIIKLSEEEFLTYYNKYYTLENCVFFLYGNIEIDRVMQLINQIEKAHIKTVGSMEESPLQSGFDKPVVSSIDYFAEEEDQGLVGISFVVGEATDVKLMLAFDILEHILLKSMASPLTKKLVDEKKLGKAIMHSGFDTLKRQPTFSIVLQGGSGEDIEKFKRSVREVLEEVVENGIDPEIMTAAFNHVLFGLKEADLSYEPIGVVYSERIQNNMRYGGKCFEHIKYGENLEELKKLSKVGYFEKLIQEHLLDNNHCAVIIVEPKSTQEHDRYFPNPITIDDEIEKQLIKQIKIMEKSMERRMNNTKDILPKVDLSDLISTQKENPYTLEKLEETLVVWSEQPTKGINYIHLLFDTSALEAEELNLLGLLVHLMTYINTTDVSTSELENKINQVTGELNCSLRNYITSKTVNGYTNYFKISSKVLSENVEEFFELLEEIIMRTIFTDREKLRNIISELVYSLKRNFSGAPEYVAVKRLYSYILESGRYDEQVAGMAFYQYLYDLEDNFEERVEETKADLYRLCNKIFKKQNLIIGGIFDEGKYFKCKEVIECFVDKLEKGYKEENTYVFNEVIPKEGFIISSNVQTVAMIFNFKELGYEYKGSMQVLASIIENMYLWEEIRIKGGAYGVSISIEREGAVVLCSYNDPNASVTLEVFKKIGSFLETLELEVEELESYIIGEIGQRDMPLSWMQKSERMIARVVMDISNNQLQKEREQILGVTVDEIRKYADMFKQGTMQNKYCIIGNERQLSKISDLAVQTLFK